MGLRFLQHLQEWFYKPYSKMMKEYPEMARGAPFESVFGSAVLFTSLTLHVSSIKVKGVKFSYHVEEVFNVDIPNLQHGNDGLIYTSVNTPYLPGTDKNMCVCSCALSYHTRALTNSETSF